MTGKINMQTGSMLSSVGTGTAVLRQTPVTISANKQAPIILQEGDALTVKGATSTTGTVARLDAAGATLQTWTVTAGTLPPIGPFAGTQQFLITCTAGSIDTTVGDAVLGAVRISADSDVALPGAANSAPAWWRKRASSIMWLGDSITWPGGRIPIAPVNRSMQELFPAYTNINALGIFVGLTTAGPLTPNGSGTTRYYAATASMTWQAFGDTEGVQVPIPTSGFYRLPSGTGGDERALYFGIVSRYRPAVDKSDSFTITTGTPRLKNNAATHGIMGWSQALLGPVLSSYCYAIPSIKASEWLEAKAQWQTVYTDLTVICLGTNDITDQATAAQALADVTALAKLRVAIGSTVVIGCLFPYDTRSATATAAVMRFNRGVRSLADALNLDVFDAWAYLAAPAGTGAYAPGMSLDGLHPTSLAGYIIAKRTIVPILRKYVGATDSTQFAGSAYNASTAPLGNLLTNGQLVGVAGTNGTGSSGEVPTSFTCARLSGSNIVVVAKSPGSASPVARTDGRLGSYASFAVSNAGGVDGESIIVRCTAFITSNWAAGDYLVVEGDLRIAGSAMQYLSAYGVVGARQFIGLMSQSDSTMGNLDGDTVSLPFRSSPMLVEAGDTNLNFNVVLGMRATGTAVLELGQTLTIHKVPAP